MFIIMSGLEMLFSILGVAIVLVCLFALFMLKYLPGTAGEWLVHVVLKSLKTGKPIHNLMVQVDGKSSQIDHVLIHPNGIFVIETKNYHGWIYGNVNQERWTQVLAYGRVKNQFYNPIKQNRGHLYALNQVLKELGPYQMKGIVIFLGSARLAKLETNGEIVTDPLSARKAIQQTKVQTLSQDEIEKIYAFLIAKKNANTITNKEHVAAIHARLDAVETQNKCPRCGGQLVLRNGKSGSFYGCSNYPKCKFTKRA